MRILNLIWLGIISICVTTMLIIMISIHIDIRDMKRDIDGLYEEADTTSYTKSPDYVTKYERGL